MTEVPSNLIIEGSCVEILSILKDAQLIMFRVEEISELSDAKIKKKKKKKTKAKVKEGEEEEDGEEDIISTVTKEEVDNLRYIKEKEKFNNAYNCPICTDVMKDPVSINPCTHKLCKKCFYKTKEKFVERKMGVHCSECMKPCEPEPFICDKLKEEIEAIHKIINIEIEAFKKEREEGVINWKPPVKDEEGENEENHLLIKKQKKKSTRSTKSKVDYVLDGDLCKEITCPLLKFVIEIEPYTPKKKQFNLKDVWKVVKIIKVSFTEEINQMTLQKYLEESNFFKNGLIKIDDNGNTDNKIKNRKKTIIDKIALGIKQLDNKFCYPEKIENIKDPMTRCIFRNIGRSNNYFHMVNTYGYKIIPYLTEEQIAWFSLGDYESRKKLANELMFIYEFDDKHRSIFLTEEDLKESNDRKEREKFISDLNDIHKASNLYHFLIKSRRSFKSIVLKEGAKDEWSKTILKILFHKKDKIILGQHHYRHFIVLTEDYKKELELINLMKGKKVICTQVNIDYDVSNQNGYFYHLRGDIANAMRSKDIISLVTTHADRIMVLTRNSGCSSPIDLNQFCSKYEDKLKPITSIFIDRAHIMSREQFLIILQKLVNLKNIYLYGTSLYNSKHSGQPFQDIIKKCQSSSPNDPNWVYKELPGDYIDSKIQKPLLNTIEDVRKIIAPTIKCYYVVRNDSMLPLFKDKLKDDQGHIQLILLRDLEPTKERKKIIINVDSKFTMKDLIRCIQMSGIDHQLYVVGSQWDLDNIRTYHNIKPEKNTRFSLLKELLDNPNIIIDDLYDEEEDRRYRDLLSQKEEEEDIEEEFDLSITVES